MPQPLLVHFIFHPGSAEARAMAVALHAALNDDPALPGLRIPTAIAPEDGSGFPPASPDARLVEHDVFVVLADDKMAAEPETVPPGRMAWSDFAVALAERCRDGQHRFLPVQLTEGAFPLDARLDQISFLRAYREPEAERPAWLARRLIIEISRFLMGLERGEKVPLRLFVSHAKQDIQEQGPFELVVDHLKATQPIESWIDSAKIDAGTNFAESIETGVRDAQAVLALVTTHYSTRPWCRREVLLAKRYARPLVIADCLDAVDTRAFPYLGNSPAISFAHGGAARVIDLLLKEHLRRLVVQRRLDRLKRADDAVFTTWPELATLASLPGPTSILYPDPPLGDDELEVIKPLAHRVQTPLQRAGERRSLTGLTVALSTSESDDIARVGALPAHLQAALVEISRHLLVRGASLAYGGHLGDKGYTQTLFNLVRAHQALATLPPVERIINYIGWPVPLTDKQRADCRPVAKLIRTPRPDGVEVLEPETFVPEPAYFPASSAERRYAWARGMTAMRERQAAEVAARVVIGGTSGSTLKARPEGGSEVAWYSGRIPGVMEEALLTLRAGRPLYVCGGLGGVAALLADLLEGQVPPRFTWEHQRQAPFSDEMRRLYAIHGVEWWDYPAMRDLAAQTGAAGLAASNGLNTDENRELFRTCDVDRIVELLLTGLERVMERLQGS
jgi:SLOG cluster2/TIR domain